MIERNLQSPLGYEILDYLAKHPKAQDTLEGIVEWWLLEQRIVAAEARVREALAELMTKHLVNARQGRDGRLRYRLNSQKTKHISALVNNIRQLRRDQACCRE